MLKEIILTLFISSIFLIYAKDFKGAEIYSKTTCKYGRIDIRMKAAKGSGLLSTFFTYKDGSEQNGAFWEEIDIEIFGKNNAEVFQSNIITNNPKEMSEEEHHPGFSMAEQYHTYTLEWTPDYVAWYIDGEEVRRSTGSQVEDLTSEQSFRMNIWASESVPWVGPFNDSILPRYQFVNWISYAEYTPGEGDNGTDFTFSWKDDLDSFNNTRWGKANWTYEGNRVDFTPNNVVIKDGYLVLALTTQDAMGFKGEVDKDVMSPTNDIQDDYGVLYPNPASDHLFITANLDHHWSIFNLQGEIFQTGNTRQIDLRDFTPGLYFIQINNLYYRITIE